MASDILLVEDNPITRKMVRVVLERDGLSLIEAPTGAMALDVFARQSFALVLQDLVLPDFDGFELVHRMRALPGGADVPILAFSGLLSKADEARIAYAGFDDVISKPAEPSRLLQIVRTHLPAIEPQSVRTLFGKGRRAIVADDDPVQRKLVAFRMTKVGFEVVTACDGHEALELARANPPDVIVSDVLMPRLDGFGLCVGMRADARLARVPVVLTTNSYLETGDRDLARKSGASELVLRTPDLKEVMETVRTALETVRATTPPSAFDAELEGERMRRMARQLERQVTLNAGVAQRCALLSAQLAVVSGISEALAGQHDIDDALRYALAACFDACGVSLGALFIRETDGSVRAIGFGTSTPWSGGELDGFFGEPAVLADAMQTQATVVMPGGGIVGAAHERILSRAGAASGLLVPLVHKGESLGALLMMARTAELNGPDRMLFARTVAGQIAQALAVTRAFAQKQASERIANERASVLRSILDSTADALVVSDESGRFTHFNPAAERILRMGPIDTGPRRWSETYGFYEADQVTPMQVDRIPLVRAMRGESVERVELFVKNERAPEGVWVSVNAMPWKDDADRIRGGVAVFRDVTQEKVAQAQLMVSDRMASVGMLAAGVAHEINNPLAAVLGNLEIMHGDLTSLAKDVGGLDEVREMVVEAREAADRVRQIVRDLKIFSRHEETDTDGVDVCRVLESSLRMARNEIRHRAQVVRDYPATLPAVEGTESRLGQVFLNLIVNAAQAIAPGNATKNAIRVVAAVRGVRWWSKCPTAEAVFRWRCCHSSSRLSSRRKNRASSRGS